MEGNELSPLITLSAPASANEAGANAFARPRPAPLRSEDNRRWVRDRLDMIADQFTWTAEEENGYVERADEQRVA